MSDKTLGETAQEAAYAVDPIEVGPPGWEAAAQAVRARVLAEPRIAACLAACDGISTEALEAGGKIRDRMQAIMDAVTEHAAEVLEQDAKMRAALQRVSKYLRRMEQMDRNDLYHHSASEHAAMAAQCEAALSGASVPAASTWTREPPTEPGWWWLKDDDADRPACVEVVYHVGKLVNRRERWPVASAAGLWCRAVPPELPKET